MLQLHKRLEVASYKAVPLESVSEGQWYGGFRTRIARDHHGHVDWMTEWYMKDMIKTGVWLKRYDAISLSLGLRNEHDCMSI